jgi:hypothetical protein
MKLYTVTAPYNAFSDPLGVARSLDEAIQMALDAAKIIDNDGYHDIYVHEVESGVLYLKRDVGAFYTNANSTATEIGRLYRDKQNLFGTWKLNK